MEYEDHVVSNSQQSNDSKDEHNSHASLSDSRWLNSLEWRSIGPYRGGRVVAVAGDPVSPLTFYFGSTGGGVWKTTDGGLIWENVSDGFFKRASVGAIAVAPSDHNVIYAGLGETTIRGNVSHGDGVYKSSDGGHTWIHLGLQDSRHIAKIRVHPHNPDLVYVAAFGHAHGPNGERGLYRSSDGGHTWQRILYQSDSAGAIDLAMDPHNPRILYASFWEAVRLPYTLVSGGAGSGLFKSSDGGDSWTEITRNSGLPSGLLGKIGVTVSPARADRVWAIIEAEDGALFRSDDGGNTWQRVSDERDLRQRAWYYMHLVADPQDAETLWVLNVQAWKSIDGGKSFFEVSFPHGDHHDLWIDPHNPTRMIEGNDGGACVSFNGGASWSSIYNQPTAEFYHVTTDNQVPYRVYGAQQDNSTISVPSRSTLAGITFTDMYEVGGGESGYIAVRADNPAIIYAGNYQGYLTRYDHRSRQSHNISPWPELASGWGAKDQKYRFQWTYPIMLSPHDPQTLYVTGNVVLRSTDEGVSWQPISPDLTRNDSSKMEPSGGPITKDNTGAEYYGTIFAFAESPMRPGLFWAGSDDGLVHISRDNGASWQNITPHDLPEWALISIIEPSPHDPAVAYIAATRYRWDDFQPYLYKTCDYGATWSRITSGIAANDFTRVIREDPTARGLLFAGTETGIYVSIDDGAHWQPLQLNLPVVPIHDLVIKDSDLVVATHGRSFWILDDITPLRQITGMQPPAASAFLFKPRPTIHFLINYGFTRPPAAGGNFYRSTGGLVITSRRVEKPNGQNVDYNLDAGQNPPNGVIVYYYLHAKPEGEVTLAFLDSQGNEIKTFSSEQKESPNSSNYAASSNAQAEAKEKEKKEKRVPKEAGTNRFVWNLRLPDPTKVEGYIAPEGALVGPTIPPGTYQVKLSVEDGSFSETFTVVKNPNVAATNEDLLAQFELRRQIHDKLCATHDAINTLRNIRRQLEAWQQSTRNHPHHDEISSSCQRLNEQLSAIEEELIQRKAQSRQDTLNYPAKLSAKLAVLGSVVSSADAAPTQQHYALFADLTARIDAQLSRLQQLIATDVPEFNALLRRLEIPAIMPS